MKIQICLSVGFLFVAGCASAPPPQPHIFVSKWQEQTLPKVPDNASNTIKGNAFLTTVGGDVKKCSGNVVTLIPGNDVLGHVESAYEIEYNSLSDAQKSISDVDKDFLIYNSKLKSMFGELRQTSVCDVDGKFEFNNVPPGSWTVKTKVVWQVPKVSGTYVYMSTQGGPVSSEVFIPRSASDKTFNVVATY